MKTLQELKQTANLLIMRTSEDGGIGEVRYGKLIGSVIWSYGGGWEHVSIAPYKRSYTPSWDEMCRLKDMFFHDDEVVVQYHPAKSEYVNNLPNCLHLWRSIDEVMPTPPSIMVGVRSGQTSKEIREEIESLQTENGLVLTVDGATGYFPKEFIINAIKHYIESTEAVKQVRGES